jgi:RNA polymerase sigma-70 factor, ECF subfamily
MRNAQGNSHQKIYVMPRPSPFEETFLPHLDAAYNLARWILGTEEDAKDVVQEAYARAWKGYPKFRGGNPRAWLLTIVHNTALTWNKKYIKRKRFVPLDEESCTIPVEQVPSELSLAQRTQQLENALNRLPAEFREVLVLFEIEGWSYKEIAKALEVPLGTVMSRLSRARCRLRKELEQNPSEESDR